MIDNKTPIQVLISQFTPFHVFDKSLREFPGSELAVSCPLNVTRQSAIEKSRPKKAHLIFPGVIRYAWDNRRVMAAKLAANSDFRPIRDKGRIFFPFVFFLKAYDEVIFPRILPFLFVVSAGSGGA